MILPKLHHPLIPHFPQLQRQPASLHRQIICQLLSGKRDVEFVAAGALGHGGQIRHELGAGGALAHMDEFFTNVQVIARQLSQEISDHSIVVGAG